MRPFTTYKRWTLRPGCHETDLLALVQTRIRPAYQQLPGCLGLGLQRIPDSRSYLAIQYWQSRQAREEALAAESYRAWHAAYEPALALWDGLMVFEAEWEGEELLDSPTP